MASLEIALLGAFQVTLNDTPATGFRTDKMRALLAYLCTEAARPHRREALMDLLWPDQPREAATVNLRQALFKLRQLLGENQDQSADAPDFLLITQLTVQFNGASDYQLDVTAFSDLVAATHSHRHRNVAWCTSCHGRLEEAGHLYRGDFMEGFTLADSQPFDEWLVLKREGLRRLAIEVYGLLVAHHEMRGEYAPALGYIYRQLELEPWDEESHRKAMWLLAATGRRSAALAQYQACKQVLARELDVDPTEETTALFNSIRAGMPVAPLDTASAARHRHNLPAQVTPFIGRDHDLARLGARLEDPDYRLITLVGLGGVGKTRLALQAAGRQVGAFDDGIYWVPLASIDSPQILASRIAQAVGFHFEASENPQAQLLNYLRDKEMLLVLDNFEHLLSGAEAADLLLSILTAAPRISILVTSRERLGLQAEYLVDLSGLPLPSAILPDLSSYDAVQLFVERARQANSEFALTEATVEGVVDICRLVEGLPLGIVLAAAWVRHFSPARIAGSIKTNLDFLVSSSRDAAPQHASLRAAFNHSWDLLSEVEREVFRKLTVFRGGWEEEAAEKVAGASLPSLLSLTDKSLLRQDAAGRFNAHEVVRQYGAEKLAELPAEQDRTKRLHAQYYLELAEVAEVALKSDEQDKWLDRLEREHDNLRAALAWARDSNEPEIGLRLAGALSPFWFVRGHFSEGREALKAVLSTAYRITSAEYRASGEHSVLGTRHLALLRAKALRAAGDLARAQGDYAGARLRCEESLVIYRELGDKKNIANALMRLAIVAWNQGESGWARSMYEEALILSRELGDRKDIALALGNLGLMAFVGEDYATARSLLEESVNLSRELGDKLNLAIRLNNLGNVALMQGDHASARPLHEEALVLRRELGDKWGIAVCLIGLGDVAISAGCAERGTRLLGAAETVLNAIGAILEPDDRIPYEHGVASARAQLEEEAFAKAWGEGNAMPVEQAIAYALEDTR